MAKLYRDMDEFWPHYLDEHSHPVNRGLHITGTAIALVAAATAIATRKPKILLTGLAVGYGLAWLGHYAFERNKPATLEYPLKSLRAGLRMSALAATGHLGEELRDRGLK